jgi:hypothetical protein
MNFIIFDRGDNWLSLEYERILMFFYYGFWLIDFWNSDEDLFKCEELLLLFLSITLETAQMEVIAVIMFIILNLINYLKYWYQVDKQNQILNLETNI